MKKIKERLQRVHSSIWITLWINILLYPFGYEVSGVSYDMKNGKRGKMAIHIGRSEMYKNDPVIKLIYRKLGKWANKHLK